MTRIIVSHPFRITSPYQLEQNLVAEIEDGEILNFSGLASFCGATYDDVCRAVEFMQKLKQAMERKEGGYHD